ncbi:DgyrCDS2252 [Dimorphilus gyrociliatus]|uniref:DgyrCDS2252 n=1 Tax=Dimorphilus gyrociliatus TaxID=2664684 RepID=A0A7I8V9P5_9ANNE|nr:DgyrCDS2252 [Dimorphilus gyrociliatus]
MENVRHSPLVLLYVFVQRVTKAFIVMLKFYQTLHAQVALAKTEQNAMMSALHIFVNALMTLLVHVVLNVVTHKEVSAILHLVFTEGFATTHHRVLNALVREIMRERLAKLEKMSNLPRKWKNVHPIPALIMLCVSISLMGSFAIVNPVSRENIAIYHKGTFNNVPQDHALMESKLKMLFIGTCENLIGGSFKCHCSRNYYGGRCEHKYAGSIPTPPPTNNQPCKTNSCKNNGVCYNVGTVQFCKCPFGFTGSVCEKRVTHMDPCLDNPCNQGRCERNPFGYTCFCGQHYEGKNCERAATPGTGSPKPNPCISSPCGQFGKCYNITDTAYFCLCNEGYSGSPCKKHNNNNGNNNACKSNPCQNGGICIDNGSPSSYRCNCLSGTSGINCEQTTCPKSCQNRGLCKSERRMNSNTRRFETVYKCECLPEYLGENCEYSNPCLQNPCENKGICSPLMIASISKPDFACKCVKAFEGKTCSIRAKDVCAENPCQNEGSCVPKLNPETREKEFFCVCIGDWKGKTCSEKISNPCLPNPCRHNGICRPYDGSNFYCTCTQDYYGKMCEIENPCSDRLNLCLNKALCFPERVYKNSELVDVKAKCVCPFQYAGSRCEIRNPCLDGGFCMNQGSCVTKQKMDPKGSMYIPSYIGWEEPICKCSPYFAGKKCQIISPCLQNYPCQNGECSSTKVYVTTDTGTFASGFTEPKCDCPADYSGKFCENKIGDPCADNPCKNNGRCILGEEEFEKYYCECDEGYTGDHCETPNIRNIILECGFESECNELSHTYTAYPKDKAFRWIRRNRPTLSGNTGPLKAAVGSYFIYTEASKPAKKDDFADMYTRYMDIKQASCLSLSYHMNGANIGSLSIFLEDRNNKKTTIWTQQGHQGRNWLSLEKDIAPGDFRLVIHAVRGKDYTGDIAIDNLKWRTGSCFGA